MRTIQKQIRDIREGDIILKSGHNCPVRAKTDAQACRARGYFRVDCDLMPGYPRDVDPTVNSYGTNLVAIQIE